MSEEILKALMQLFAIIVKQDGGAEENETLYVRNFLNHQIGESGSEEYFAMFSEIAGIDKDLNPSKPGLTSVIDSVRILGICKKINKTLNQTQKFVVLVRLFELVASDRKLTKQRIAIIKTVSDVFKISEEEYKSIEIFVLEDELRKLRNKNILVVNDHAPQDSHHPEKFRPAGKDLAILRISKADLYFIKYQGELDLYLNGLVMITGRIYIFAKGSTVRLPVGKPLYYSDIASRFLHDGADNKISFRVENISYSFKDGFNALNNISFEATHGNLIGILGASGTGKTTLLNVLSGMEKPGTGNVMLNEKNLHKRQNDLSGVTGYVPQDDVLIEELTVFENLYFNAKLCFKDLSKNEIVKKVDDTLSLLGLYEKKNLKVGSAFNKTISGGQRKRLNIALELIREPSVLFLDEPTSGLSSGDSENVMDLLRELTLKGKLIISVIHQPSSEIYKMFDKIVLLDQGGHLVYYGNPVEAVMYFKKLDAQINADIGECPYCGNVNPEIIFNILEARIVNEYGNYTEQRKVKPRTWKNYFQKTHTPEKVQRISTNPPKTLNIPGRIKQFRVFILRDFLSKISNRQYVLLTLLEAPFLALILAYIIRYIVDPSSDTYIFRENENIPVYIFMAMIVAVFLGLTISAEEIFKDRKILKRESFLNLSRSSYLISKISILFIISAFQALTFVLLANAILEIKNMNFYYWIAFFSSAAFANLLGLNISSSFNSAITIYIIIPLLIIPMMVLSGAMFSFEKLNRNITQVDKVPFLAEFMPTKWTYEALMVHQFKNNFFQQNFYSLDKKITNSDYKLSFFIPELDEKLNNIREEYLENGEINKTKNDLRILENELFHESSQIESMPLYDTTKIQHKTLNEETFELYKNYLSELRLYYLDIFTNANKRKTNKVENLIRNKKDTYYQYLNDYHNESVSDHVRKIYEKQKIVEYKNRLIRLTDPIYHDPQPGHFLDFRSHFFAPEKYFFGKYHETFWFNIAFVWFLTILLYIMLYYRILKKIMNMKLFGQKKVNRSKKN